VEPAVHVEPDRPDGRSGRPDRDSGRFLL